MLSLNEEPGTAPHRAVTPSYHEVGMINLWLRADACPHSSNPALKCPNELFGYAQTYLPPVPANRRNALYQTEFRLQVSRTHLCRSLHRPLHP